MNNTLQIKQDARFINAKAVVISYPNSGRSWLQNIIKSCRIDKIEFTHDILEPPHDDSVEWQQIINNPVIDINRQLAYSGKPVVILTRNPKDVIVSSFYQKSKREPWLKNKGLTTSEANYQGNISNFINNKVYGIMKIISFMNSWPNYFDNGALLITYEGMHKDIFAEVRRFLYYVGYEIDEYYLSSVINENSFKNSQRKDQAPPDARKYRSGKIGDYKRELVQDDINRINNLIEKHLHPMFREIYG